MTAPILQPPPILTNPSAHYADSQRRFQGIPGIERAPNGRLWALWYSGGDGEGPDNYVIAVTSGDDGATWSAPCLAIDPPGLVRAYDPCLWIAPTGQLWLFWAQCHTYWDGRSGVWAITTDDPGAETPTWSAPRRLCDGIMMNKPTVLSTGEWLLPAAVWSCAAITAPEFRFDARENARSNVIRSTDQGATWSFLSGADVPGRTFDEHSIIERRDGSLWMLVRTTYGIGESLSTDRGRTWSPGKPSGIPHVDARFLIRRLQSGRLLLVTHNPPDGVSRSHLIAHLSDDDGATWQGGLMLDARLGVSYPDGVQSPEGTIYVIYDWNRFTDKHILMATFTEADVLASLPTSPQTRLRVLVNQATGIAH